MLVDDVPDESVSLDVFILRHRVVDIHFNRTRVGQDVEGYCVRGMAGKNREKKRAAGLVML
jgi:hypothetical protein